MSAATPKVVEAFRAHGHEEAAISTITVGELYFGALRSRRPEENSSSVDRFLDRVAILGLDRLTMRKFAEIKADLFQRGRPIEDPDLLIAASALVHGVPLITHNLAHFGQIPGLTLHYWAQ